MSERKVLTKYYPPDFDPSQLRRAKKDPNAGPKVQTVRLMAPFSMKCTTCGEYIYRGRKFNSRKETPPDERYLGIQIFRFHIKCTRCSSPITFRTDPKNNDYAMVRGALRSMDPWHNRANAAETDAQRLDRLEAEQAEDEADADDPMQSLEAKTRDAQHEIAVADALDQIRMQNAARARAEKLDVGVEEEGVSAAQAAREELERQDAEAARRAFQKYEEELGIETIIEEEDLSQESGVAASAEGEPVEAAPVPAAPRAIKKKKKKDYAAALGLKPKKA